MYKLFKQLGEDTYVCMYTHICIYICTQMQKLNNEQTSTCKCAHLVRLFYTGAHTMNYVCIYICVCICTSVNLYK